MSVPTGVTASVACSLLPWLFVLCAEISAHSTNNHGKRLQATLAVTPVGTDMFPEITHP